MYQLFVSTDIMTEFYFGVFNNCAEESLFFFFFFYLMGNDVEQFFLFITCHA